MSKHNQIGILKCYKVVLKEVEIKTCFFYKESLVYY